MALSAPVLKALIISELAALGGVTDAAKQEAFAQAMANAIVTHITTSAVVNISGNTAGGDPVIPATGTIT